MRTRLMVLSTLLVLSPVLGSAQAPRPVIAPGNTVLLAAYNCAADQLARADAIVNEVAAPVLNKQVQAGNILNWGYTGVYIGNQNNRSIYVWATDPVALMQARKVYLPELQANPKFAEFVKICGSATITVHNLITSASVPAK
jgi:hypothetical protein